MFLQKDKSITSMVFCVIFCYPFLKFLWTPKWKFLCIIYDNRMWDVMVNSKLIFVCTYFSAPLFHAILHFICPELLWNSFRPITIGIKFSYFSIPLLFKIFDEYLERESQHTSLWKIYGWPHQLKNIFIRLCGRKMCASLRISGHEPFQCRNGGSHKQEHERPDWQMVRESGMTHKSVVLTDEECLFQYDYLIKGLVKWDNKKRWKAINKIWRHTLDSQR